MTVITSCSGYRFAQSSNPLAQYGIESLSVPMFYNYSGLANVSPVFTRETYRLLSRFNGLKLYSGYSSKADAVLIGILRTPELQMETLVPETRRVAQRAAETAVGDKRPEFYIPGATRMNMLIQVVVVKRPLKADLDLIGSDIGQQLPAKGKILFNETFTVEQLFNREIFDGESTAVNATQNRGAERRAQDQLAEKAAIQIRDMILYAF